MIICANGRLALGPAKTLTQEPVNGLLQNPMVHFPNRYPNLPWKYWVILIAI